MNSSINDPGDDARTFKASMRAQWDTAAAGWNAHSAVIRSWLHGPTEAMCRMAGVREGARVLDVDRKSLQQIANESRALAQRIRQSGVRGGAVEVADDAEPVGNVGAVESAEMSAIAVPHARRRAARRAACETPPCRLPRLRSSGPLIRPIPPGARLMKRLLLLAACLAAAGCSDSKVVVRASLAEAGEPIVDLPVFLLPYDRQALMDSLAEASDDPEPTIPSALITQLESLNARERQMAAAGDSTIRQVRAQRAAVQARMDSIRVSRRRWREQTFADFDSVADMKMAELGVTAATDTTDASGQAIAFDGLSVKVSGTPADGDTFTVAPSAPHRSWRARAQYRVRTCSSTARL